MAKITVHQKSFAAGLFSPDLDGRHDLAKYQSALRECKNFIVNKFGALDNRPGTIFVREVKDSTKKVRLIPFKFGEDQNFVLEFGNLYVRFYHDGGIVLSGGVPLEVATPYLEAELPLLKWAQVGDVITIVCGAHDPMELKRHSNTNWTLDECPFVAPTIADYHWSELGTPCVFPDPDDLWLETRVLNWTNTPRIYDYAVAMVLKDAEGRITETKPVVFSEAGACVHLLKHATTDEYSGPGAPKNKVIHSDAAHDVKNHYVCLVGAADTDPDATMAGDDWDRIGSFPWGAAVTYVAGDTARGSDNVLYMSIQNANLNHDPVTDTAHTYWIEYRMCWTWIKHQSISYWSAFKTIGRLTYLPEAPITLNWPGLPVPDGYTLEGFRLYRGEIEGDPLEPTEARRTFGLIADLASFTTTFTDDGSYEVDWTRSPRTGENPLDSDPPTTVAVSDQRRMFGRRNEIIVSALGDYYNLEKPSTVLADSPTRLKIDSTEFEEIRWMKALRVLLFGTGSTVPYVLSGSGGAQDPFTSTSFSLRGQEKWGSSWVDPAIIRNIMLVLDDTEQGLLALKYNFGSDGYTSELLSVFVEHFFEGGKTIKDMVYQPGAGVLWLLRSDGRLLGLTFLPEQELVAWHWHETSGQFESLCVSMEAGEHRLYAVVKRTVNGSDKRYVEAFASRRVSPTSTWDDVIFLDSALTLSNINGFTSISGLGHLEGREVMVLADGAVVGPLTVTSGAIDLGLDEPVTTAVVGLAYESEIETLDAVHPKQDITDQTKRVLSVTVKVKHSRGLFVAPGRRVLAGAEETVKWREWAQREVAHGFNTIPLASEDVTVRLSDGFNADGRIRVKQTYPMPLSILRISREIELGND